MESRVEILVVDDDPDLQETLRLVLETRGFVVRTAGNGREARLRLSERLPDLIILDIMMDTDTEGFELAHELKSRQRTAHLPILLLTCFLEKVRAEGPDAYQHVMGESWPANWMFEKPVDVERLLAKIAAVLGETSAGAQPSRAGPTADTPSSPRTTPAEG
jgi:DNA-binding response OmpR family regulator